MKKDLPRASNGFLAPLRCPYDGRKMHLDKELKTVAYWSCECGITIREKLMKARVGGSKT